MTAVTIPPTVRSTVPTTELNIITPRSNTMYSLHEALARERMRDYQQRSSHARLAGRLASERRYHRAEVRRQRRNSG